MSGYFRSLFAELLPGWTFWRSSRRPSAPLEGAPAAEAVEPASTVNPGARTPPTGRGPTPAAAADQPPADPDSLNRRL